MEKVMMVPMTVSIAPAIDFTIQTPTNINMGMNTAIVVGSGIPYEGAYTVIPTSERQVLPTERTMPVQDIIVEPIPSNYGLITWDGATLTVS